jgi:hypothetical protein
VLILINSDIEEVQNNNAIFWDLVPCRYFVNRRFGGTYHLHLQGRKIRKLGSSVSRWLRSGKISEKGWQVQQRIGSRVLQFADDGGVE